jgi:hypothetical protein
MSNPDDTLDENRPDAGGNVVRTAAVIIYATFALLIATIPQSLTNWLRDMDENPLQQAVLVAADALQSLSQRAGLDIAYRRARAEFKALTGKEDD